MALAWYRKAANQGFAAAQTNLGVAYDRGQGVQQDYIKSYMWFILASSQTTDAETRDLAAENRDVLATKMSPAQIAEAQELARKWVPTFAP
jgi:TPR repeat protein